MKTGIVQKKRSWNPFIMKDTGKWYTGWDRVNRWGRGNVINDDSNLHETRQLELTPVRTTRVGSSASMFFKDRDGYEYEFGLNGGLRLIQAMSNGKLQLVDKHIRGEFMQVKRGSQVFIEPVLEDED